MKFLNMTSNNESGILSNFSARIKKEMKSYGKDTECMPLCLSLRWLDMNSTYIQPLTGSCFRPIVHILLNGYTLYIPSYKQTFTANAFLSIIDLHGSIVRNSDGVIGQVFCWNLPVNITVTGCYSYDKYYSVDYDFESNIFWDLSIKRHHEESYLKVKSEGDFIHNIRFSDINIKNGSKYDQIADYCSKHGLSKLKQYNEITAEQKCQLDYINTQFNNTVLLNNPELHEINVLYHNCIALINLHKCVIPSYVTGNKPNLSALIDPVTAPFSADIYKHLMHQKRWDIIEKMLNAQQGKEATRVLYELVICDTAGFYHDMPLCLLRLIAWKRNRNTLLRYIRKWCKYEDARFIAGTKPMVSSPLKNMVQ